jgi:hypothetical protein
MHGGVGSGPKTSAGRARIGLAHLRHGFYTAAAREERRQVRELLSNVRAAIQELKNAG